MKKIVLSALALTALAGVANAQSVIDFKIIERNNNAASFTPGAPTASASMAGNATDGTLWLVVFARITGSPQGNGIAGFAGSINITSGSGGGAFKGTGTPSRNGSPTNFNPNGSFALRDGSNSNLAVDSSTYVGASSGNAIYSPYRVVASLGPGANGDISATGLTNISGGLDGNTVADFTAGNIVSAAFGSGNYVPVYAFQYDITSNTARTLTFRTNFSASFFTGADANNVPTGVTNPSSVVQGTYSVDIVPAPASAALLGLGGLVAARRRRA